MAGGGHHSPIKVDPAIERWGLMRQTVYERFRLTPRNTLIVFVLGALIPYGTFKLAQATDARWDLQGKKRGESLLARPPPANEDEEA